MVRTKLKDRFLPDYTKNEEIFNMVSHIVGAVFGIAALVLTVVRAATNSNSAGVLSGAIYGATMILLYTVSSVYHGLHVNIAKKVMQIVDHCTIFLLIAGTYTPVTISGLCPVNPVVGWLIFGFVWLFAIIGIILNAIDLKAFQRFSMICYLGMGWCAILAVKPMIDAIEFGGLMFLLSGGVLYTIGAVLYGIGKKKRFIHSVFHLFVLFGSIVQFLGIFFYIV